MIPFNSQSGGTRLSDDATNLIAQNRVPVAGRDLNVLLIAGDIREAVIEQPKVDDSVSCEVYNIQHVHTLSSAIAYLRQYPIDIVVLDLNLHDSQGLATLLAVRACAQQHPIIVLADSSELDQGAEAIQLGADDYISKEKLSPENFKRAIRYAIERRKRLRAEMEINGAAYIQRQILDRDLPKTPFLEIAAHCESATAVGADFYDFVQIPTGIAIVVCDVSGHGLGPSLLAWETRGILRTIFEWEADPGVVLTKLNRVITNDCMRGAFVTVFLAVLSEQRPHTLRYAAAGHDAYWLDAYGIRKARLSSNSPPVGIIPRHQYDSFLVCELETHDMIFCCTDGITEACPTHDDQFFGIEGALETLGRHPRADLNQMLGELFHAAKQYDNQGYDDMTAVLLRIVDDPVRPSATRPRLPH